MKILKKFDEFINEKNYNGITFRKEDDNTEGSGFSSSNDHDDFGTIPGEKNKPGYFKVSGNKEYGIDLHGKLSNKEEKFPRESKPLGISFRNEDKESNAKFGTTMRKEDEESTASFGKQEGHGKTFNR